MSPKSNRSGVSYNDNDPRSLSGTHPLNPRATGPVVTRARDLDAAREGLPSDVEVAQARGEMNDSSVNEQYVEGDGAGEALPEAKRDYSGWSKKDLNAELDDREIEHDPKASNPVLADLLEADDAHRAEHGDGANMPPSGI